MTIGEAPSRSGVATAVLVLALATGCAASPAAAPAGGGAAAPPSVSVIAPPAPDDRAVPAPAGPPLLTLTGLVGVTNAGRTLRLDAAGLDRMGLLKVEVYEPWVKQNLTLQGTWLADLLTLARTEPGAHSLHFTALDDYQIDLTTADVAAGGIFLATRRGDGTPIPIDEGGPTRIVFVGGVASGASADQWIWSLKTIDVR